MNLIFIKFYNLEYGPKDLERLLIVEYYIMLCKLVFCSVNVFEEQQFIVDFKTTINIPV